MTADEVTRAWMASDTVTRARRALDLLARGALHERRASLRVAVMADLNALAEAVEELARLRGELAAAAEAVAGARAEAATVARTCREEVALLRGRLELSQRETEEQRICVEEARRVAMREADLRIDAERRAEDAAATLDDQVGA